MALYTYHHDAPTITAIGRQWVARCLVGDGSMFGTVPISDADNFDALDRFFVQRPDAGSGSFYEKLEAQLHGAPPGSIKLMAELLWALFLFPSNIGPETKREGIVQTWGWSGDPLDPAHPLLTDAMLDGVGSGGMGVNTNRWREMNYMIRLGQTIKAVAPGERASLFDDYDRFMAWMDVVPQEGDRQFRHMLRYFLFPERVERMSSNGDRYKVLEAFGVAPRRKLRKMSDRQLDDEMLALRRKLQQQYGERELDFYLPPLREGWKKPNEPDELNEAEEPSELSDVREPDSAYATASPPRNLILHGPPGTGKTWRMQQMFDMYTDQPADLDRATWEHQLVARYGWRAVIAAALGQTGKPTKAGELEGHPLVRAKAVQRKRSTGVKGTMWGYMQEHTIPDSKTVNVTIRRAPYVFDKTEDAHWYVVADWKDQDSEASELLETWQAGPGSQGSPVKRYRLVTFHPSYSYEDFVIGLRPVTTGADSDGAVGFRMVDGVFKQACEEARANQGRRYALFIDEINRANIAKVFGELITLIEPDKRARYDEFENLVAGMEVQLPGTGSDGSADERFGVPENLDIIGTMNTADRSIALLDIALRRRFEFREIGPDYGLLDLRVDGVDLGRLLRSLNDRIEFLADRDRLIGHAYFTRVRSIADLRDVFLRQVIPLLQEYFFDDWSRVALVLSSGNGKSAFIRSEVMEGGKLFGGLTEVGATERVRYEITSPDGWDASAFTGIYTPMQAAAFEEA